MAIAEIEREAAMLAAAHAEAEEDTIEIYLSPDNNEIRMLEVGENVADTGEVLPFTFEPNPSRGINHSLTIVVVSIDEMRRIQSGELSLPDGWGPVDRLVRIWERAA